MSEIGIFDLTEEELKIIKDALICYYKIRTFQYLPYNEKCEIRENLSNYHEIMQDIDYLIEMMDNFIELKELEKDQKEEKV